MKPKYILQDITIAFLLVNFAILYAAADYTNDTDAPTNKWDTIWYVIEAVLYALFAFCLMTLNAEKKGIVSMYRKAWRILASFLTIRAIWEISAVIQGVSVNEKMIMAIMFGLTFAAIFIIAYLPQLLKIWQRLWH